MGILRNKKSTLKYQYRFLRSNYFQKFLFNNGLNVANVEDIFRIDGNKIAAKHSFIGGTQIDTLDEKTAYELGKTIANFHITGNKNFAPKYPNKYKIFALLDRIKSKLRIYKECFSEPYFRKLPKGICHYDLNFTNILFYKNKIFLIDFDRWRYWPFACELVRFIPEKPHKQEIINGYQSVRPLTAAEKKYISKKFPELNR